jgi:hypothetical protein
MGQLSGQQVPGPASPEPPIASQAQAAEQPSQETKPIDEAAVRKIAEEIATRTAQSLVDKAEYRISKKAQDQIRALELNKQTLGLDDNQVMEAKQKIVMNDLTAPPAAEGPASPQQPASGDQPEIDPVFAETLSYFNEQNVTVEEGDPEFKGIKTVLDNPKASTFAYIAAVLKAVEAKKARVASQTESAPARVLGGGETPGQATAASSHELWDKAYSK